MRDLGHLQELSSTVALGLWADDVVIALDDALSGRAMTEANASLLQDAAKVLEAAAQRTEHPMEAPRSAHALAATDSALNVVATLIQEQPGEDVQQLLKSMAEALAKASKGQLTPADRDRAKQVLDLFGLLGEHQLVASNSVLNSRKEAQAWTGAPATSISS